jgi:hypothetical protein
MTITIFNFFSILCMLMFTFNMMFGVNLRKAYGWIQVLIATFTGILIGASEGSSTQIVLGFFFFILNLWLGNIRWQQRHG